MSHSVKRTDTHNTLEGVIRQAYYVLLDLENRDVREADAALEQFEHCNRLGQVIAQGWRERRAVLRQKG